MFRTNPSTNTELRLKWLTLSCTHSKQFQLTRHCNLRGKKGLSADVSHILLVVCQYESSCIYKLPLGSMNSKPRQAFKHKSSTLDYLVNVSPTSITCTVILAHWWRGSYHNKKENWEKCTPAVCKHEIAEKISIHTSSSRFWVSDVFYMWAP